MLRASGETSAVNPARAVDSDLQLNTQCIFSFRPVIRNVAWGTQAGTASTDRVCRDRVSAFPLCQNNSTEIDIVGRFMFAATSTAALVCAGVALAGTAAASGGNAQQAVEKLQIHGHSVVVRGDQDAPVADCRVDNVSNGEESNTMIAQVSCTLDYGG